MPQVLEVIEIETGPAPRAAVGLWRSATCGFVTLPIERDLHFEADRPISEYASLAHDRRRIVT